MVKMQTMVERLSFVFNCFSILKSLNPFSKNQTASLIFEGPISVLLGERGRSCSQGSAVTKTRSNCKSVENGNSITDDTMLAALSELGNISLFPPFQLTLARV